MSTAGSIRQNEANGTWGFVVDVPSNDGKRRQIRRRGFRTKKAAQAELAALIADAQRGVLVAPNRITLGGYLVDTWLPAKRSTLRASTLSGYEHVVTRYVLPELGKARLQAMDGAALNSFYQRLLTVGHNQGHGLAPKTVRNVHGVLSRAMRDAVRWGHLQRNPCDTADPPSKRTPEMRVWTSEQLRAFAQSVEADRWAAVWLLLASTGMRRGEVLGLRWTDADLSAGTVTIRSTRIRFGDTVVTSTPKTARGNRAIALGPDIIAALKAWKKAQTAERLAMGSGWRGDHELIVTTADGAAVKPDALSGRFATLVRRSGLPPIRLHDVRHSYATAALAAGVPVKVLSQRLGHAGVGITLEVYAHVLPGDDQEAARRADALLFGP